MRMANRPVKTNTVTVRRFASATRPSTPDSGVSSRRRRMRELGRACDPAAAPVLPVKKRVPFLLVEAPTTALSGRAVEMPVPASSTLRPVASSPARISSATMTKLASSEEPPWLIKGRVTPVSGMSLVTPPTIKNAWNEMAAVRPVAVKAARSDLARAAVVRPRTAKSMKASKTAAPPSRPISSPMAEKMKSDSTMGMSLARPLPTPTPVSPPSARE